MDNISRHKVFISYYHADDQYYKNQLINMKEYVPYVGYQSIFEDCSVRENDIDDTGLSSERIRQIIRDDYIQEATVLILLCGQNTKRRKHVDWEIHAAMFDTQKNPKMGILVVNLPTISQPIRAGENEDKILVAPYSTNWYSITSRQEYEAKYPYMPSRIIDNFAIGAPISVVDWNTISNDSSRLKSLIHNAFLRRKTIEYDHSAPLRKQNS